MKKLPIIISTLCLLIIGCFICFQIIATINRNTDTSLSSKDESMTDTESNPTPTKQPYLEILEHMTLEQKIGQMLIIRNSYTTMTPEYEAEIAAIQPGGYIIFDENITTLAGTRQLIADTRETIETASSITLEDGTIVKIPAILSVDQEGGSVQRLQSISDYPPEYIAPMQEIGASNSAETAYETGLLLAKQCKNVGLNLDYAPVADIYSNPQNIVIGNRAFGTDRETVATMSIALAQGLADANVIPVFKHFPGHGDTIADSHETLPIVLKTLDELEQNELYPFRKAIDSGAEIIMVAHIALPSITGDYTPASLSPTIITDILKEHLNYNGIVITDGLDMNALTDNYLNADIATKAVLAGADLLLTPASPLEAKNAILSAVELGTITETRIDESVTKILKLKLSRLNNTP